MTQRVWILGASDPEMAEIESILRKCGEKVVYAAVGGSRVHPGNAYIADSLLDSEGREVEISGRYGHTPTLYRVECDGPAIHRCLRCGDLPDPERPDYGLLDRGNWGDEQCSDMHAFPTVVTIDHHYPGDPGYGRPPEDFLKASSIGRVLSVLAHTPVATRRDMIVLGKHPELSRCLLTGDISSDNLRTYWHLEGFGTFRDSHLRSSPDTGNRVAKQILNNTKMFCFADGDWYTCPYLGSEDRALNAQYFTVLRVPTRILLIAAADHCLAAAYRGECPGVDPDALMRWRVESRAAFQKRPVEEVLADVEAARAELAKAPFVNLVNGAFERGGSGPISVRDLRARPVPELPEAAAREGVAFLATVADRDGRKKVVLGGAATPEIVKAFMESWAPSQGLIDLYGDPARGFAGGYLP